MHGLPQILACGPVFTTGEFAVILTVVILWLVAIVLLPVNLFLLAKLKFGWAMNAFFLLSYVGLAIAMITGAFMKVIIPAAFVIPLLCISHFFYLLAESRKQKKIKFTNPLPIRSSKVKL